MAVKRKKYTLNEIWNLLTEEQKNLASGQFEDAKFMEKQLADLRRKIKKEGQTEEYQYGTKQTAAMTTYLQIQKQYGVIIKFLAELIPKESAAQKQDELLAFLRDSD